VRTVFRWGGAIIFGGICYYVAVHQSVGSFAFLIGFVTVLSLSYAQDAIRHLGYYKKDKSRDELRETGVED
jgi:hypothetical protein